MADQRGVPAGVLGTCCHHNYCQPTQKRRTSICPMGADQELEACCDWLDRNNQWAKVDLDELRDGRRPKPPSKIEIAEKLIARYSDGWTPSPNDWVIIRDALAEGRRAQEALSSD